MESAAIVAKLLTFRDGILVAHGQNILGVLDSLDLIELIQFMQDEFEIQVGLEDVTVVNFRDVSSITALVEAKMNHRESSHEPAGQ
jgi:hypothetical protein